MDIRIRENALGKIRCFTMTAENDAMTIPQELVTRILGLISEYYGESIYTYETEGATITMPGGGDKYMFGGPKKSTS